MSRDGVNGEGKGEGREGVKNGEEDERGVGKDEVAVEEGLEVEWVGRWEGGGRSCWA